MDQADTHQVFNQSPPLENVNLYRQDPALQAAVRREGAAWAEPMLADYGALVGGELQAAGFAANAQAPVLHTHDPRGYRIDCVAFHPAYHLLMAAATASGWPTLPWAAPQPGVHVARAAMEYLHHQAESGTGCPLTMTFAAVPVIRRNPALAAVWEPLLLSRDYDPDNRPWFDKRGATVGMGMTEKQGGTDVRANTTRAAQTDSTELGDTYEIVGHKWFMSAPMCDAFLVLAQAEKGLSCFLLPRWRPDGSRNQLYLQRLKDKLGNRSNASGEVEFRGAFAWRLGDEGRGVATILEMVALTRFDCMVGSASLMRGALVQALHHCQHREVSGRRLVEQPLMQNVLADMAVESEAALVMSMRVARALDQAPQDSHEQQLLRVATALGKYLVCKRAPGLVYEAMECLGGNGYVEESVLPRLYREAPVNAIWEGSGNVQCLDVLRALDRSPESREAILAELELARGLASDFDRFLGQTVQAVTDPAHREYRARRTVEHLALALQASLLLRFGNAATAEAYCRSRLGGDAGYLYGSLPVAPGEARAIIEAARLS
ncbi:MAG TPA: isovaleryl-CoA dehydrogenase [Spongiibacteraceae bacterium]|jgi:putative acyl-CoA dehydrogenase|nr:isovaleryl-CoA dehydrogenase [Spongiibacteraceae bacterium]HUH36523.1 isovaleryl-CoA dehydrogenase [Spongiibacteraceae bacterium]